MVRGGSAVIAVGILLGSLLVPAEQAEATPAAAVTAASTPSANSVSAFGAAGTFPGPAGAAPDVGIAPTPDGGGYWLVGSDGGVFTFGDAGFFGSMGNEHLNQPVVGMAATPDGRGYWLVSSDGGVFTFGDAGFYGSMGGKPLNRPVVGIASAPDGGGYWLVAADGGIFTFGDAGFHGSTGSERLNQPVVGMAATPGGGYWLVAADGGIFTFGGAPFLGSTGNQRLNAPVVGMAPTPDGGGYWLVAADGGIFTFGNAPFEGSGGGTASPVPAVGIARRAGGYWIAYGHQPSPIPGISAFVAGRADNVTVEVDDLANGQIYSFRPGVVEHTASTVKVDILSTLLTQAQAAGRPLTAQEQALAVPMIEDSLDSAANALWVQVGYSNVGAFERAAGMTQTVPPSNGIWGTTTTSAADRIAMMRALVFPNSLLSDASRAYILGLMENITPSQDWGATGGVPPGVSVALKNGFSIINGWQINDEAWVTGQGRNYLIAMLSDGNPTEGYGIDTLNGISTVVWNALAP